MNRTLATTGVWAAVFLGTVASSASINPSYEMKRKAVEMVHSSDEARLNEGLEMMNDWAIEYRGYWGVQAGDGYLYMGTPTRMAYRAGKVQPPAAATRTNAAVAAASAANVNAPVIQPGGRQ